MTCILCKGNMTQDTTSDFTDLVSCMVIIKNVPCLKCVQCGEKAFTGATVKQIERIVYNVKDSLTEVAIVQYSDVVA